MIRTIRENFILKRTITANLKRVNFLDVTFNCYMGKYQPYKKPNDTPTYISVKSNHPPDIIKALANKISKRISNILSNKATLNNAAPFYNDALSASGYKEHLIYQKYLTPSKKVRQRKILWFNPWYSVKMKTKSCKNKHCKNFCKTYLKAFSKHQQVAQNV